VRMEAAKVKPPPTPTPQPGSMEWFQMMHNCQQLPQAG